MRKYTDAEMAKRMAIKATRAAVRTKHSIAAEYELNEVLPDLDERIDAAILGGERLEISMGELFDTAFDGKTPNADNA